MNNQKEGLAALERLMADYYEMCQDLGNNDDQYQRCNLTSERAIIEQALKEHEQYKAIEEKMKMPIDKFFKALGCKDVVCWEYWEDKPRELVGGTVINVSGCVTDKDTFGFDIQTSKGNSHTYWSYDYGKTWALTKEELL